MRKVAGRLMIEALQTNENQTYFCHILEIDPLEGAITLNSKIPTAIRLKLKNNPQLLSSIKKPRGLKYWSFPEFHSEESFPDS